MIKFKNVVSLFDGHSGGRIALDIQGIKYENYYSSEIDKYAIQASDAVFPDNIKLGNVIKLRRYLEKPYLFERMYNCSFVKKENKQLILHCTDLLLDGVDLLMGGSPCTGFSFAGKQLNFNDSQSKLFFEFIKIKNILNPRLFLLENVRMKKEYYEAISKYVGVEAIKDEKGKPYINSALVSAQNRMRSYWTNIEGVKQPEDRGILLKDILEDENSIDEKYYIKGVKFDKFLSELKGRYLKLNKKGNLKQNQDKASTLTGGGHSGGNHSDMDILLVDYSHQNEGLRFYEGKAPTLNARDYKEPRCICVAQRGRNIVDGKRKDYNGAPTEQRLEPNLDGKTNCLTTVGKDNLVLISNSKKNTITDKSIYYEKDTRTLTILQELQEIIREEKNGEWAVAIYARFFKDDLLFKRMYESFIFKEQKGCSYREDEQREGTKNDKAVSMCEMQSEEWTGRPSYRYESSKQFIKQLAEVMSELSLEDSQTEKNMYRLWKTTKRVRLLRKALSTIQEIWRPIKIETEEINIDKNSYKLRRLTVRECGRLQTIPEPILDKILASGVSNSQLYKIFGNGWNVETIAHIFSFIK